MAAKQVGLNVFQREELLNLARKYQAGEVSLREVGDEKISQMSKICSLGFLGRTKQGGYKVLHAIVNCECSKGLAHKVELAAKSSALYSVVCNYKANEAPKKEKKADELFDSPKKESAKNESAKEDKTLSPKKEIEEKKEK